MAALTRKTMPLLALGVLPVIPASCGKNSSAGPDPAKSTPPPFNGETPSLPVGAPVLGPAMQPPEQKLAKIGEGLEQAILDGLQSDMESLLPEGEGVGNTGNSSVNHLHLTIESPAAH